MIFEKNEKTGTLEIKNFEITLKKSLWEKISGFIWGMLKLALIFILIGGIFAGDELNKEKFFSVEKTYFDSYFREESERINSLKIGVLDISGVITSKKFSGLNPNITNAESFISLLVSAIEDKNIDAILIRVNSPGGEVLATEQITTIIDILRKKSKKKIYFLLESMATSGGYYVSTSGEKIFAYPETLLGNIGVRIDIPNVSQLLKKVGVEMKSITSGELKTMGSPFREMTEEEKKIFENLVHQSYEKFVSRVSQGRNLSIEETKKLSDGRIFSGTQGKESGLVDELISSFPELAMKISLDMNKSEKSVQFVLFKKKISGFERFMMSVRGNISQLQSEFIPLSKMQFLMK